MTPLENKGSCRCSHFSASRRVTFSLAIENADLHSGISALILIFVVLQRMFSFSPVHLCFVVLVPFSVIFHFLIVYDF